MLFRKKNKRKTKAESSAMEMATEVSVSEGVEESSAEPVMQAKHKRQFGKKKTASIDEIRDVVRPSIFKTSAKEMNVVQRADQSMKKSSQGLFNVPEDEQSVQTVDLDPEIASAFGLLSKQSETEAKEKPEVFSDAVKETEDEVPQIGFPVEKEEVKEDVERLESSTVEPEEFDRSRVLSRLERLSREYTSDEGREQDTVDIIYHDDDTPEVVRSEEGFMIANKRVYINGERMSWDELFEVKIPGSTEVEVETDIGFSIPKGCVLKVLCNPSAASKFYFKQNEVELSTSHAAEPIVFTATAMDGAYLSKVGRLIECQVVISQ